MEQKTYRIYYKNGNALDCQAYDMELEDNKLYQSTPAGIYNDMPWISVIDGSKIDHIEEV